MKHTLLVISDKTQMNVKQPFSNLQYDILLVKKFVLIN